MSEWEELLSPRASDVPATIFDASKKESVIKKESIDELMAKSVKIDEDVWKRLGGMDFYNMGRMYGACNGPDDVSIKDVLGKFSTMIAEMVKESYIKAEKSVNKEVIDVFLAACKAIASMENMEVSVYRPKLLAAINGFGDSYVMTSDPESVKNISMQQ